MFKDRVKKILKKYNLMRSKRIHELKEICGTEVVATDYIDQGIQLCASKFHFKFMPYEAFRYRMVNNSVKQRIEELNLILSAKPERIVKDVESGTSHYETNLCPNILDKASSTGLKTPDVEIVTVDVDDYLDEIEEDLFQNMSSFDWYFSTASCRYNGFFSTEEDVFVTDNNVMRSILALHIPMSIYDVDQMHEMIERLPIWTRDVDRSLKATFS